MATNSTIAVQLKDGSVAQIFCHWDGQLSHNGKILFTNYNNFESVNSLVCLGNLSSLGKFRDAIDDVDDEGSCEYQTRDKGENWFQNKPNEFETLDSYKKFMERNSQEFNYIFIDGDWFVSKGNNEPMYLVDALLYQR